MRSLTASERYVAVIAEFTKHPGALSLARCDGDGLLLAELFFNEDQGSLGPELCSLYLRPNGAVQLLRQRGNWNDLSAEHLGDHLVNQGDIYTANILLGPEEFVCRYENRDARLSPRQRARM